MKRYLLLAACILSAGYTQAIEAADYFCSNTEKPPDLRVITVQGEFATVESEKLKLKYKVLENINELLVLGKVVGLGEAGSTKDGFSLLVLDKRTMVMQVVNALTDKAYVEPKSTCMSRN